MIHLLDDVSKIEKPKVYRIVNAVDGHPFALKGDTVCVGCIKTHVESHSFCCALIDFAGYAIRYPDICVHIDAILGIHDDFSLLEEMEVRDFIRAGRHGGYWFRMPELDFITAVRVSLFGFNFNNVIMEILE